MWDRFHPQRTGRDQETARAGAAARRPGDIGGEPAVALCRARVRRGGRDILRDVSFEVGEGTICGLLAPSGAGKTTVLRLLAGIYPPTSGTVRVHGRPPHHLPRSERRRLGYMPQQFALYPELSVRRNLEFAGRTYAIPRDVLSRRIAEALDFVDLRDAERRVASRLSGGMRRRLQLAATLLPEPEVLIVDEPTAGIDPLLRERFWERFRTLRSDGVTMVISTQYVTEAEYCDFVVLLHDGRTVETGTPAELFARARVAAGKPIANFEEVFRTLIEAADRDVREPLRRQD